MSLKQNLRPCKAGILWSYTERWGFQMNCQKMAWKKLITYLYARKNNPCEDYYPGQRQVWALKNDKARRFTRKTDSGVCTSLRGPIQGLTILLEIGLDDCQTPSPLVSPDSTVESHTAHRPSLPSSCLPDHISERWLLSRALTAHCLPSLTPSRACSRHKHKPKVQWDFLY